MHTEFALSKPQVKTMALNFNDAVGVDDKDVDFVGDDVEHYDPAQGNFQV